MDKHNNTESSVDNSTKNRPIRLEDLRIEHKDQLVRRTPQKLTIDVQDEATSCAYESGDFQIGVKVSNKLLGKLFERLEKTWQK